MTKKNELAVLNELFAGENALTTQTADELRELDAMSTASSFLQRLQLYSKGKVGPNGTLIEGGHYGVPKSSDNIVDLGDSIDVLAIARKAKAIDMSDTENIIVTNDTKSDEFKRIVDMADNVRDSGCAYGPAYLVYERSTSTFYELFCGNKSGRYESSTINTYLPVTTAMIEGGFTKETEPRFAKPMTLKSKFTKKGKWEWFSPVAEDCLSPIDLPSADQLRFEIERFAKMETPDVETVDEKSTSKRKR
jgi:hypothetical protein